MARVRLGFKLAGVVDSLTDALPLAAHDICLVTESFRLTCYARPARCCSKKKRIISADASGPRASANDPLALPPDHA